MKRELAEVIVNNPFVFYLLGIAFIFIIGLKLFTNLSSRTLEKVTLSVIVLIFIIFLSSCSQNRIETIDGCQYIETTSFTGEGPVSSLTHSGTCNNKIHYRNIDTDYIVIHDTVYIDTNNKAIKMDTNTRKLVVDMTGKVIQIYSVPKNLNIK